MNTEQLVHFFHIIIVGGLFLYVGIKRNTLANYMFSILLGLGIIIVLYHAYKTYNNISLGKSYWINLMHILIIGPLLIYIGLNGENTSRKYF